MQLRKDATVPLLNFIKKKVNLTRYAPLFKKFYNTSEPDKGVKSEMDDYRMHLERFDQVDEVRDTKWMKKLKTCVEMQTNLILNESEVKYWSILKSLPGGEDQDIHADIPLTHFPCGAGIVSIMEGTKLNIFRDGNKDKKEVVEIPFGYAIIFDAGFCHSGVAYDKEHYRLYFKFAGKNDEFKEDYTKVDPLITCTHCGKRFSTVWKLEFHHKFKCLENGFDAELREMEIKKKKEKQAMYYQKRKAAKKI